MNEATTNQIQENLLENKETTEETPKTEEIISISSEEVQVLSDDTQTNQLASSSLDTIVTTSEGNVSLAFAMYNEQIKTNFYLSLILTVTVVFFVINKFWSFCRRLFTVKID